MRSDGRIVVAGEALVDLVPAADGTLAAHLGGGPFTTARALGRLGVPVAFAGRLSSDRFGQQLAAALAADAVALDLVQATDDPTTLALAELDAAGAAQYRFYAAGTSAPGLGDVAGPAAALHVGSLGLVLEPMAAAVERLVARLAGTALVMVDPNVRPAALADPAAFRARLDRVIAHAGVVKASDEDLGWLGADPAELLARGPAVVIQTRGGEGAVAHGAFGAVPVAAPRVDVVDTIGAGDTFSAGWLAWWLEHGGDLGDRDAVRAATEHASRAAALACARAGASPPTAAELERSASG